MARCVKTTIDISDALLERAKRQAARSGTSLRALVEEGLRRVLSGDGRPKGYQLPDRSVGTPGASNPLESYSWPELRDEVYGGR